MKILDRYIIRQFLGTLGFMLCILSIVVTLIDVQSKTQRIERSGYEVSYFLVNYYPYWIVYLVLTFMSILVFVSVILFTSRLANNTEIVAYISSGASFHRFTRPYLFVGIFLALFALTVNHFVLPWANMKKNELAIHTFSQGAKKKYTSSIQVSAKYSKNEYIFINDYSRQTQSGTGYKYQKFDDKGKLVEQIIANSIRWDKDKKTFILYNYHQRKAAKNDKEILSNGIETTQNFKATPEELFPDELLAENKTTPELLKFINREKDKGNSSLNAYLNVLYQRTSMPFSIIILTFLALSLSSQKRRGGIGSNLAIGVTLAFVFIFSFEALKVVAENKILPSLLAMWLPNIVFTPITVYLYLKRANE